MRRHPGRAVRAVALKSLARRLEVRMLALALLIALGLSLLSPYFLTHSNIFNMLDQSVVIGIVAVGMTFVILTGGIDLSVGSVARTDRHHSRTVAAVDARSRRPSWSPCSRGAASGWSRAC